MNICTLGKLTDLIYFSKNAKELFGNMKNVRFDDDEC